MFSSGPNYTKLKTNLRLACNRLKLLEKKKTELAQKARKEIADYLMAGKPERAKIRVEHIIREDYLVEAMEIVEMYCDLILARFGLITQMKEIDEGIEEAVSTIIWVAPRLQSDVQELKICADIFAIKYGKPFADSARAAAPPHKVSDKVMHKLAIQAPPKLLIEKYIIEIAKIFNVDYEPDPLVMKDDKPNEASTLIDLSDRNNLDGGGHSGGSGGAGGGGGMPAPVGFIGYPLPPAIPQLPQDSSQAPFNYPGPSNSFVPASAPPPFSYNIPPNPAGPPPSEEKDLNINANFINQEKNKGPDPGPPPSYASLSPDDNMQPRSKISPDMNMPTLPNVPFDLPDVPSGNADGAGAEDNDEIDFDELSRRFEELKKKKY
ncbi:IST1 homolog isoform X2 [Uranotaenia lowii]|uniref:IST1 homolog isoform X2 n=1 Tax=Uranotaenia lowii TaxID=190385 RepID=UPI00247A8A1A|nr:IST1 homolog isoform X2 [Uranotaenia lowii]